uniref:Uncharacterized protein n=1 Tax=Tetradesmus obliquus TaxID=3088 RepID=A0A383W8H2_TETOB
MYSRWQQLQRSWQRLQQQQQQQLRRCCAAPQCSWAILPTPSMWPQQEVVLQFITEQAAAHAKALFVERLRCSVGAAAVQHHVEPHLPHSWAILPTPSMWPRQEVVLRFITEQVAAHAKGL